MNKTRKIICPRCGIQTIEEYIQFNVHMKNRAWVMRGHEAPCGNYCMPKGISYTGDGKDLHLVGREGEIYCKKCDPEGKNYKEIQIRGGKYYKSKNESSNITDDIVIEFVMKKEEK